MEIGAKYLRNGECEFSVWAPLLQDVALKILSPEEQLVAMTKDNRGYWHARVENVNPAATYLYVLAGEKERPDPASSFQPNGVHKASQLIDHNAFPYFRF